MVLSSQKGQFEPYHKLRSMWTLSLKAPSPPISSKLPLRADYLVAYDMKIDNAEFIELLRQLREGLDRIGLRHRVEDAVRRYAIADAIGAPDIDDGFGDFERQPRAIFDPAAIDVGAFVAAVAGELIEQIAVRAVQLDAVKAGPVGILGASAELLDDARKLGERQRPRRHQKCLSRISARLQAASHFRPHIDIQSPIGPG